MILTTLCHSFISNSWDDNQIYILDHMYKYIYILHTISVDLSTNLRSNWAFNYSNAINIKQTGLQYRPFLLLL